MRICKIVDFAVSVDPRINLKVSEKKDKYLDLARELKKLWSMTVTIVPIVIGALGTIKRPGGLGSLRTGRDYTNDSIAKNGQNSETSPGDLRRLAVTQTPVKNHQLTLMWKTLKEQITIIIETTLTVYMYLEKREEVDLPASTTALTHRYIGSKTT